MKTLLSIFFLALALSLLLTPLAARVGVLIGAVDRPDPRKVHFRTVPRFGGPALLLSVFFAMAIAGYWGTEFSRQITFNMEFIVLVIGGLVVFITGLVDDVRRLGPKTKFALQILGCSLPYAVGVDISHLFSFQLGQFGHLLSYPLTLFWFLLFINAINLIDGLDGLAGGMVFIAAITMVILSVVQNNILLAAVFAALAGSLLGFLRYNFSQASIFLGDGGSYFLGYCLAGLSVYGSVKSQVGSIMLITILVMGIPLIDTLIAPIRRFIRGKKMFYPDKGHIHHRLLAKGLTSRNAVLVLYLMTIVSSIAAVAAVSAQNELLAVVLIIFGVVGILFFRQVGYMDYLAGRQLLGWASGIVDAAGLSQSRRVFFDLLLTINRSASLKECWRAAETGFELIGADSAKLYLVPGQKQGEQPMLQRRAGEVNNNKLLRWSAEGMVQPPWPPQHSCFKLETPLFTKKRQLLGLLSVEIDLAEHGLDPFAIRRLDNLRQSLEQNLERLHQEGHASIEVALDSRWHPKNRLVITGQR